MDVCSKDAANKWDRATVAGPKRTEGKRKRRNKSFENKEKKRNGTSMLIRASKVYFHTELFIITQFSNLFDFII